MFDHTCCTDRTAHGKGSTLDVHLMQAISDLVLTLNSLACSASRALRSAFRDLTVQVVVRGLGFASSIS
jgi:hypothetical protein